MSQFRLRYFAACFHLAGLLISLGVASTLLYACGEETKIYDIGIFGNSPTGLDGLKDGLKTLGYIENKNIRFHQLIINDQTSVEQQTASIKDFVAKNYNAYWTLGQNNSQRLKEAVTLKPVVIITPDPVQAGLIHNREHPEGNVTGIDNLNTSLYVKRLDWLRKIDPNLQAIYLIYNPKTTQGETYLDLLRQEANRLKVSLLEKPVNTKDEAKNALTQLHNSEAHALIGIGTAQFFGLDKNLSDIIVREKLLFGGSDRSALEGGAIFSYGTNNFYLGRQSATYLDKLLHGTKPIDLPIVFADKIELILNQKLADQIGLKFPEAVLNAADEVVK